MTAKQKKYKFALIKAIHCSSMYKEIYSKDRGLYEIMLMNSFGVKSSKKLNIAQLISLKEFLNTGKAIEASSSRATHNQLSFILALWKDKSRNKDLFSLFRLVKKIISRDIKSLLELSKKEAMNVIVGIKGIKKDVAFNNTKDMK